MTITVLSTQEIFMEIQLIKGLYCVEQEMPYFDDHKNRVGVLTTKLASDAALVQGVSIVSTCCKINLNIEDSCLQRIYSNPPS